MRALEKLANLEIEYKGLDGEIGRYALRDVRPGFGAVRATVRGVRGKLVPNVENVMADALYIGALSVVDYLVVRGVAKIGATLLDSLA